MHAIYTSRVCGAEEKEKCELKHGRFFEWECKKCREKEDRVDAKDILPLTHFLLQLRRIIKGGPQIPLDTFDLETWERLGMIGDLIESIQRRQQAAMMFPRAMGL